MKAKLERLAKALKVPDGRTAVELSLRLNCAIPTVYRRIEKLREEGIPVYELVMARRRTGPAPTRFTRVRP